jgi:Histidine kinase-, DNA gyrase B-, and HSP90-like ATPase
MKRRGKRVLAWSIFAVAMAGLVTQMWFAWLLRNTQTDAGWNSNGSFLQNFLFALVLFSFPIAGLLIALRLPQHPVGWLLLFSGLAWSTPGNDYGLYSIFVRQLPLSDWVLASDQWTWLPAIGLLGTFTILLYPDGHLPSPRWRWLAWLTGIALILGSLATWFFDGPIEISSRIAINNPFGIHALNPILDPLHLAVILVPISIVASAVSLVQRFRRSHGIERQQIRWLAYAAGLVAMLYLFVMTVSVPHSFTGTPTPQWVAQLQIYAVFSFALIPMAIGVAILRYHLWDLDLVLSKTVVAGLLLAFITIVYVALVVGLGSLLGDPRNPALSIAATALVALLFGPVRERVRRFANHLVFGKRATPYEVMAGFAHRVSGSVSVAEVLPEMAEVAARGVGARGARVRVALPDGAQRTRAWPEGTQGPFDRALDVAYQGAVIGWIDLAMPPERPLRPAEERLLEDLAAQAGLALHNVRLTEELEIRAEELAVQTERLRISRERLVTARDAQRRGLERDIREGPERQLHEIRGGIATLDVARPAETGSALEALTARANETLEGLRDLARGIFPPLLADQGVVAALEAHVRKVGAHAEVHATPAFTAQRYGADVEACLYFCCLQAIQNVIRHAENAPCTVALDADESVVRFQIVDRGLGFDRSGTPRGMGMDIMQDRIDALEGELSITSVAGRGTTVAGVVPRSAVVAAPA